MPESLAQKIRAKYPGVYDDLSDAQLDAQVRAKYPGAYDDIPKSVPNQVTANPADFTDTPPPQTFGRLVGSAAKAVLPSTTPSDYIKGPANAIRHPWDQFLKPLGQAMYEGSADQASKAGEAAQRMYREPTFAGRLAGASEMLGHGAGMVPIIGTPAAAAGEQIASGDIVGGVGTGGGLLAPFGVSKYGPKVKAVVGPILEKVVRGTPVENMKQALGAGTKEMKTRAQRVAPEMVTRGIWEPSLKQLETRARSEATTAGQDVKAAVAKTGHETSDVIGLIDALEKVKASALDTNRLGDTVVIEPNQVKAIESLQSTLAAYGDRISNESLNKVRLKWDDVVQAGKGFTTADPAWSAWAAREGRQVLRDRLSQASNGADIDAAMHEFSFWKNVQDISANTNLRKVGQGAGGGLLNTIATGAGSTAGALAGSLAGGAPGAVAGAALGALAGSVKRLVSSPGWKMFTAVQRQRIADAVASGKVDVIESAYRAANGGRLVGHTPPSPGRLSIVGVDAGQAPDEQRANR